MPSLTRGPLPSSVYWRRRLIVITVALLLVVVIAKMLGGGDGSSGGSAAALTDQGSPSAGVSSTEESGSALPTAPVGTPTESYGPPAPPAAPTGSDSTGSGSSSADAAASSALPDPVGDCSASDVAVTPAVDGTPYAYDRVTLAIQLHTLTSPACTWHVSPDTLQIRITRGGGDVWTTIDCRGAIGSKDVVVRRDSVTVLPVVWLGHKVVADACSAHAPWAVPGHYQIVASSLGGEPAESEFTLLAPGATPPATSTSSPSASGSADGTSDPSSSSSPSSPASGTSSRSAAVD